MTSIFGGFVIFSYVGHMAGQLNVTVDHVADDGKSIYKYFWCIRSVMDRVSYM